MKCEVCGQDYGLAHNCAGVAAYVSPEEAAPAPEGFAPLYYFRLAFNIARWDDVSIRRASRDPKAGLYGGFFWAVTALAILLVTALPQVRRTRDLSGPEALIGLAVGLFLGLLVMGILTFAQLALCHFIAKWFLGATGTLGGIVRPLLLGWVVNLLILVPVVGLIAAGIAWTAVLMLVFEEVDGIRRLQAFALAVGINFCLLAVQAALLR